jgi:PAS domain S-box-containing protein
MLNERYTTLTNNLAAAVIIRDTTTRLIYCSPYTEVLTGYATREIYGAANDFFTTIIHPDDRDAYTRALKVSEFGEAFQHRFRIVHKTGLEMWAESRTVPVLDELGNVVASLAIILDVTGTVRYQRQVEERNRDLQDFTYMVSHDLKAPIFTIKGMVGIIAEDFSGRVPPELGEILDHISRAAGRLEDLVAGVLQYSRVSFQENSLERVDLGAVLSDIARDVAQALAEVGGTLTVPADLPTLRSDRLKVYQIFTNLIGNAIKYRSPERPVTITIAAMRTNEGRTLRITVQDNGTGIPADKFDLVFRPFQRAHTGAVEGSGIGLATVKKLVEKLGGEVSILASSPSGTTFAVDLRGELR